MSETLLWETWDQASKETWCECGLCSCEGAWVLSQVVREWLQEWLQLGQTGKFPKC